MKLALLPYRPRVTAGFAAGFNGFRQMAVCRIKCTSLRFVHRFDTNIHKRAAMSVCVLYKKRQSYCCTFGDCFTLIFGVLNRGSSCWTVFPCPPFVVCNVTWTSGEEDNTGVVRWVVASVTSSEAEPYNKAQSLLTRARLTNQFCSRRTRAWILIVNVQCERLRYLWPCYVNSFF